MTINGSMHYPHHVLGLLIVDYYELSTYVNMLTVALYVQYLNKSLKCLSLDNTYTI